MAEVGEIRDGFILIFKKDLVGERWVALHHIVAVTEYPGDPPRCGVHTAHSEGWIADLSGDTVREAVRQYGRAR
jgi:hypothetical protein